jgi:hypothetical protein
VQVLAFAVAPQSNDVIMFAEEQQIGNCPAFASDNQALLERDGFAVSDSAEIDSAAVFHRRVLSFISRGIISRVNFSS